ncbi:adhesion G protein-coupled receptor E5-like [Phyllostomus hastatus]|uniref:adhesion G protein-coupled receptor E5-like n=1 Tax=Phyllostomus hastatus TaxID=9423 RepID=UPI001E681FFF|nr:adhesion G protein-coupled receptor E5-like [Phyllostomus hastatus]
MAHEAYFEQDPGHFLGRSLHFLRASMGHPRHLPGLPASVNPGAQNPSLSCFCEIVQDLGRDFRPASAKDTIKNVIKALDELLEVPGDLEVLTLPAQQVATNLLLYLEEVLRTLAKTIPELSFNYHFPWDTELSLVIQEQGNRTITLGQSHARMQLKWAEAVGIGEPGNSGEPEGAPGRGKKSWVWLGVRSQICNN